MQQSQGSTNVSAEHARWLQGLDFYHDLIGRLEERLQACAAGGMDPDAAREVEHFQNQFLIQRNTIDELRHAVREHMSRFGQAVARGGRHPVAQSDEGHAPLQEGYGSFEKVMNALRREFDRFTVGKV